MGLLRRAIDWENALSQECHFHVTLSDIPMDEYIALQVLRHEQARERSKNESNNKTSQIQNRSH
jgi:hypothetical protein